MVMEKTSPVKTVVVPGWFLMVVVAVVSRFLSQLIVVGGQRPLEAIVVGLVIGILLRNLGVVPKICYPGVARFEKILVCCIVLLGASLTLEILKIEPYALIVLAVTMISAFWLIYFLSRRMGLRPKLGILLGVGTTICGGTAIAITSPLVEADEEITGYAIGTIAIWGLIALLVYPHLARLLHFSQTVFGVWASVAIHSTPQVVGAGYIYGDVAGRIATMVKLTRNAFMMPLAFIIAIWYARSRYKNYQVVVNSTRKIDLLRGFPWFLFGYVVMAFLRGFGFFSPVGIKNFTLTGKFLILVGMCGIGLNTDLKKMSKLGWKPFLAGFIASALVAIIGLGMIYVVGIR